MESYATLNWFPSLHKNFSDKAIAHKKKSIFQLPPQVKLNSIKSMKKNNWIKVSREYE